MKIKNFKQLLLNEVKNGKQVYVKILVVPYSSKPFPILVDFNNSHGQFDEFVLLNSTGYGYPIRKLKLKDGNKFNIKPARAYHVKEYEII